MMGDAAPVAEISYEEYLALERETDQEQGPFDVDRVYRGVTLTPAPPRERAGG